MSSQIDSPGPFENILPPEIIRLAARVAGKRGSWKVRLACSSLAKLVTAEDSAWAEAGERLHRDGCDSCWRWVIGRSTRLSMGSSVKIVDACVHLVGDEQKAWAAREVAKNGDARTLRILLDANASAEATDEKGQTSLILAAARGRVDIVRLLLTDGGTHRQEHLNAALKAAVDPPTREPPHAATCQLLLRAGAVPPSRFSRLYYHTSAVGVAAYAGRWDLALRFVKAGSIVFPHEAKELMRHFASRGNRDQIEKLTNQCGPAERGDALLAAVKGGYGEVVEHLLASGVDSEGKGKALSEAVISSDDATVRLLLEAGIDEGGKRKALEKAASKGRPTAVCRIILAGVSAESQKKSLGRAAYHGQARIAELILSFGAVTDVEDLMYEAGHGGSLEIVRLFAGQIPPRQRNTALEEALSPACQNGHTEIVRYLLDAGVVCSAFDFGYDFNAAASGGHVTVLMELWRRGADIRAKGDEALRSAVKGGHLEAVGALLKMGAKPDAAMVKTAVCDGHVDVAKVLLKASSDLSELPDRERLLDAAEVIRTIKVVGKK
jgi:ankyrin repeat protein